MKITTISVILSLVSCCFFLGSGTSANKLDCQKYKPQQQQEEEALICCPLQRDPVCGTNGKTYSNECLLCAEILGGAIIDLAYKGECVDCSMFIEVPQSYMVPCPLLYEHLCGTDGNTYANRCFLCAEIWKSGKLIGINEEGNCN